MIFFKDGLDFLDLNYCPMSLVVLFGFLCPFNMLVNANATDSPILSLTLRSHTNLESTSTTTKIYLLRSLYLAYLVISAKSFILHWSSIPATTILLLFWWRWYECWIQYDSWLSNHFLLLYLVISYCPCFLTWN